jgi:hypothetical protein
VNTLDERVASVSLHEGITGIAMADGLEIRFPVESNRRLARGTPEQVGNVEVSPFGIHWPEPDEDLSLRGLPGGDFGQDKPGGPDRNRRVPKTVLARKRTRFAKTVRSMVADGKKVRRSSRTGKTGRVG